MSVDHKATNVDYVVGFPVSGESGKEKATREKAALLKTKVNRFRLFSPGREGVFSQILCEIRYFARGFVSAKPDLIIARTYWGFGAGLLGAVFGIPVIREVHAHMSEEVDIICAERPFKRMLLRWVALIQLYWYQRSDGLIFNNVLLQRYYLDHYLKGRSVETMTASNGANIKDFFPVEDAIVKRQLGFDGSITNIVFCGSVSKWHGVDLLIEFFAQLSLVDSRFSLTIVGGGDVEYLEQLKRRFVGGDRLRFIGAVPSAVARDYICAADLCALPVADVRVSPGSPLKLYDYIACGKPVIAQAFTPGYSDIVECNKLGVAIDFTDVKQSIPLFIEWYNTVNLLAYAKHNRVKAENELSWSSVIDSWLEFGKSL